MRSWPQVSVVSSGYEGVIATDVDQAHERCYIADRDRRDDDENSRLLEKS